MPMTLFGLVAPQTTLQKLCTLGDTDYPTHITESVYSALAEEAKFGGNPRRMMWEKRMWTKQGIVVYRSIGGGLFN